MSATTALTKAPVATPELAVDAVRIALDKAGIAHPPAVLLDLSADFARDPTPALRAAARVADCLQIAGCTASGLFTEDEWVLDTPAVAALVLGEPYRLQATCPGEPVLTLAAPNALDWNGLAANPNTGGVTVASEVAHGSHVFWALRQPQTAEYEMRSRIDRLSRDRLDAPQFALMIFYMGRGPAFYNGEDRDSVQFTRRFPETPLIGCCGNGEIAHLDGANRLLQHSTVLALFYPHVPT